MKIIPIIEVIASTEIILSFQSILAIKGAKILANLLVASANECACK
jgi:hypothetical protein